MELIDVLQRMQKKLSWMMEVKDTRQYISLSTLVH